MQPVDERTGMTESAWSGWRLLAYSEWVSRGPFGDTKPSDESTAAVDGFAPERVRLTRSSRP